MAAGNWTDFEEKKRKEFPFNLVCPVQLKHVAPTFLPPCWALEGMGWEAESFQACSNLASDRFTPIPEPILVRKYI